MTDVQKQLLVMLKEIISICDENDIEFFIDGGTTLGAIRHRGFLPWDDDIDVAFTRENWEKFLAAVKRNPLPNRVIEGIFNNKEYTMVYARYCSTDSTSILRTSMIDQFQSGMFIDLFVLDPVPDNEESIEEYFAVLGGFAEYLNPYYYDTVVGNNEWYDFFKKMGRQKGRDAVIRFVEDKIFSYPDTEGMTYCFRFDLFSYVYPRRVIGKPRWVPFEDILAPVEEDTNEYLRIHYTDKWYMIPEDNHIELHNVVIDLDVPYRQFVDAYIGNIDLPEAKSNYRALHELRLKRHRLTREIDTATYTGIAGVFAEAIERRCEKCHIVPADLLAKRDYAGMRELFGNYFQMQLNKYVIQNRVFVPISDELLACALTLLLVEGNFHKADKVLQLRKKVRRELIGEELVQIEKTIGDIRLMEDALFWRDFRKAGELASAGQAQNPDVSDFFEGAIRARNALCETDEEARALIAQIDAKGEEGRSLHWTQAIRAFLQLRLHGGKDDEAAKQLIRIRDKTRNGMLRLEIQDMLIKYGYEK